jgi:SAM-dependent methyltransferase
VPATRADMPGSFEHEERTTMKRDAMSRFSDRVANYVRYRPGYPDSVLEILREETGLTSQSVIADVGSGTGISADLFLRHGNVVYAVEPNAEMRRAAEERLAGRPKFHSVAARAEATTLPGAAFDYVVAGQALHWFDVALAREEFARVLRPGGWVVLIWNSRRIDSTPFLCAYDALLRTYGTDYMEVQHQNIDDAVLQKFFAAGEFERRSVYNEQRFDFDGLAGRLLSSSYAPAEGQPNYEPMMRELERAFAEHAEGGRVCFEYDTEVYFGRVK